MNEEEVDSIFVINIIGKGEMNCIEWDGKYIPERNQEVLIWNRNWFPTDPQTI